MEFHYSHTTGCLTKKILIGFRNPLPEHSVKRLGHQDKFFNIFYLALASEILYMKKANLGEEMLIFGNILFFNSFSFLGFLLQFFNVTQWTFIFWCFFAFCVLGIDTFNVISCFEWKSKYYLVCSHCATFIAFHFTLSGICSGDMFFAHIIETLMFIIA
jgi:hypothetical protein